MADDIFTQETVDKLNASALTFNEVVTSRAGGVSTGAIIDQTLTPLGEATDTLKGRLDKIGTTFTDWGSAEGGTLTSAAQAFLNNTSGSEGFGNYYAWTGAFPHIVTQGLDPASTAGYAIRSNAKFFSAVTQTNDGASVSEPSLDDLRDIMRRDTAGYTLIGNTTIGCTVTAERQTVKVLATGNEYEWTGTLPKVVAPGEDPTADAQWVSRTDAGLRDELALADGANLIGGATYAQIRAYSGSATKIYCVGRQHVFDGAHGDFHIDSTDTTSADDDATILIDAAGSRWKRQYSGYVKAAWCGVVADGVTDDTARAQFAIDTFKSVEWHGVCAVSSVEFSRAGGEYKGAKFKALSNSATDCCVAITRGFLTFDILEVDGSLKANYTSAIKWSSPYFSTDGSAAQRVTIGKLSIANSKIGLLFGSVTSPVDAPQSENFIGAFTSRGVEKVLYSNQPNGYLFVSHAVIDCGRYEWVSGFSEANSTCIEAFDGDITVTSSEVLKTATDIGYAIVVDGGNLTLSDTPVESPAKVYYVASTTKESNLTVNGSFGYFGTAANDYMTISPSARGKVTLRDLRIYRPSAANQSFTGLINHNSNTAVDFVIDNVTADEFLPNVVFKGDPLKCVNSMPLNCSVTNFKCKTSGVQSDIKIQSNTKQYNALEKAVDSTCNSLYGWKRYVGYGGGDLTLVADTPALSGFAQTNSLKLVSTGESSASSLDTTSASTVHATGLRCSGGTQFLLAGWCKVVAGGAQHSIGIRTVDAGLSTATVTVAIGTTDMPQNSEWVYFEKVVTAPTGAVYAGINVSSEVGEVRFSNVHMSKI